MKATGKIAAAALAATLLTGCSNGEKAELQPGEVDWNTFVFGGEEAMLQADVRYQEELAVCMKEKGWQHTPRPVNTEPYTVDLGEERRQYEQRGLTSVYFQVVNPGVLDAQFEALMKETDPNFDYVQSLSEAEQVAYDEALYGTYDEQVQIETVEMVSEITGEVFEVGVGEMPGCSGLASRKAQGAGSVLARDLTYLYYEIETKTHYDPRVTAAMKTWGTCMEDAGFKGDFDNFSQFHDYHYEIYEERSEAILLGRSWRDIEFTAEQRREWEQYLADDILLATTDFDCRIAYNKTRRAVESEIETAVMEENWALLLELKEKAERANK